MEEKNQEFIQILNNLSNEKWLEIFEALKDVTGIYSISFSIFPSEEFFKKFNLTSDIHFSVVNNNGEGKMKYFYKKVTIDPNCYYVRPENYREVSLLEVLTECILQDTHQPDIKHLEVPHRMIEEIYIQDAWMSFVDYPEPPDEVQIPRLESMNEWDAYREALRKFSEKHRVK
jgi:hypothetical protein